MAKIAEMNEFELTIFTIECDIDYWGSYVSSYEDKSVAQGNLSDEEYQKQHQECKDKLRESVQKLKDFKDENVEYFI